MRRWADQGRFGYLDQLLDAFWILFWDFSTAILRSVYDKVWLNVKFFSSWKDYSRLLTKKLEIMYSAAFSGSRIAPQFSLKSAPIVDLGTQIFLTASAPDATHCLKKDARVYCSASPV
jgi:hypothetical protein